MMIVLRFLRYGILVIPVILTMILILGCATDQVSAPAEISSMELESRDLVEAFRQMHGEIVARVQEGTLPVAVGAEANELKIALEKYLIKTQARQQVLQLDVLYGAAEQREPALKKVVALAAESERTKMAYLQRLHALNIAHLPDEKTKRNGKFKDIEIEIGPENIIDAERP